MSTINKRKRDRRSCKVCCCDICCCEESNNQIGRCGVCDNCDVAHNVVSKTSDYNLITENFAQSFLEVEAWYTAGAPPYHNGQDRLTYDVQNAKKLWGIDIRILGAYNGSGLDSGGVVLPGFPRLVCGSEMRPALSEFLLHFFTDGGLTPTNRIYVIYVGQNTFDDPNVLGCAWYNLQVGTKFYNVIVLAKNGNNGLNDSLFAHELGHILFATVPGENDKDPSSGQDHSIRTTNVMNVNAANKSELLPIQIDKAERSILFRI